MTIVLVMLALEVISAVVVAPKLASAGDCNVVEYADHVEVVCAGTPGSEPEASQKQRIATQGSSEVKNQQAADNDLSVHAAKTPTRRKQVSEIRSLNTKRYDTEEYPLPVNDKK